MNAARDGVEAEPVAVFSLAEYLGEEMDERGWTSEDVAARMPGDFGRNSLLIDILLAVQGHPEEKVLITQEFCAPLESAFGVSEGFFMRLNAGWDKYPDRRSAYEAPEHLFSGGTVVQQPKDPIA